MKDLMTTKHEGAGGIGDAAVKKATGKPWKEWFAILDAAGGREKDHRGIVAVLDARNEISGWWCQMVTVGYEQARGLRQKHQKGETFEISASKIVGAPLSSLYEAWKDPRKGWLTRMIHENEPEIAKRLHLQWFARTSTSLESRRTVRPRDGGRARPFPSTAAPRMGPLGGATSEVGKPIASHERGATKRSLARPGRPGQFHELSGLKSAVQRGQVHSLLLPGPTPPCELSSPCFTVVLRG